MTSRFGSHWLAAILPVAMALLLTAGAGCGTDAEEVFPTVTPAPEPGAAPETSVPEPSPEGDERGEDAETPSPRTDDEDPATPAPPSPLPPTATMSASQGPALGSAEAYVDGVGEKQEIMRTKDHVDLNEDPNDDFVTYNSVPPTSGDHWSTPVRCGFYIQPVPDELVVHNMEHSNIVVSYNLTSQDDFDALVDVYEDLPEIWRDHFTVVRPYGKIAEGRVALSTWGVLDIMEGVDGERILRFFEHYLGRLGPEGAISCRGNQQSMPGG